MISCGIYSPSVFHFPRHCGIGDLIAFLIQSLDDFSGEITNADNIMNPQHFGNYICLSGNPDSNPRSLLVEVRRLGGGVCSLREHNVLPVVYLAAVSTRTIPLQVTTCILLYNNVTLSDCNCAL